MLIYDHILTFDVSMVRISPGHSASLTLFQYYKQEREYIWKKRITMPSCLFLIFRYVTPIISAINLVALHWPGWKGSICRNWIWLPVAAGPIVSAATGSESGFILLLDFY